MILIENAQVLGWEPTIRGMRNPMNSWAKSDSEFDVDCGICNSKIYNCESCPTNGFAPETNNTHLGPNDLDLMLRLAKAGSVDGKFRRMIAVYADITAPLYWWKEFDTYKVGTVANSCSTMHKIHAKEFTLDDFSHEHLFNSANGPDTDCYIDAEYYDALLEPIDILQKTVDMLNKARTLYLDYQKKAKSGDEFARSHLKEYWWQIIQLQPETDGHAEL
jgi:hypothetical protein